MDLDDDGKVSKKEHRRLYEATKNVNPHGAIVSFSAMDKDDDGMITRDEVRRCCSGIFSQLR